MGNISDVPHSLSLSLTPLRLYTKQTSIFTPQNNPNIPQPPTTDETIESERAIHQRRESQKRIWIFNNKKKCSNAKNNNKRKYKNVMDTPAVIQLCPNDCYSKINNCCRMVTYIRLRDQRVIVVISCLYLRESVCGIHFWFTFRWNNLFGGAKRERDATQKRTTKIKIVVEATFHLWLDGVVVWYGRIS